MKPGGLPWKIGSLLALLAIIATGLVLRLLGARGDLWQDEIWSIALLEPLTSIDQIFWRVNHDNNHFLNSIYLYLVGLDASPLFLRGLSIALGVATVVAAGLAAAARGWRTAIVTSLLFAVSYPMVHYGSEARGYAGLVLFTLLAVMLLERRLDHRGSAIAFALTILLGFLSHLTMIETVVVLVGWATWLIWRQSGSLGAVNAEVGLIFGPAFLAVLPLAACVLVGTYLYGFELGGVAFFSLQEFARGYGGMIHYLFGLPGWIGDWLCIAAACGVVCVGAYVWRDRRSSLYVVGVVVLPLLMAVARLPNLGQPRYFLVSGTLMLLWAGELLGRGLDARGRRGMLAGGALGMGLLANGSSLLHFYEYERGSYAPLVESMTREGPITYATSQDFRIVKVVEYFAARLGRQVSKVSMASTCIERPDWLVFEGNPDRLPQSFDNQPDCPLSYDRMKSSTYWGLSGASWTIYQRRD